MVARDDRFEMTGLQRRHALGGCLLAAPGGGRRLEGYAAVFGVVARIGDFDEVILPGAFAAALAESRDILALVDHDPGKLLARTGSGTLRLCEDGKGLKYEIDVPSTTLGNDLLALAERGDLGGMSFAFTLVEGGEAWQGNRRELRSVTLHEISIVHSWPAYQGTSVQARCKQPALNLAKKWLVTT